MESQTVKKKVVNGGLSVQCLEKQKTVLKSNLV